MATHRRKEMAKTSMQPSRVTGSTGVYQHQEQHLFERVEQQWNRAIPEAGYITLGTIRYGVKLSANIKPINCFRTTSISSNGDGVSTVSSNASTTTFHSGHDRSNNTECSSDGSCGDGGIAHTIAANEGNESVTSDGCGAADCKICCCSCSDGSAFLLPWKSSSCAKSAFEMVKRKGGTADDGSAVCSRRTNSISNGCRSAKNRTSFPTSATPNESAAAAASATSSLPLRTTAAVAAAAAPVSPSKLFSDFSVIENQHHESSPLTTCCYANSVLLNRTQIDYNNSLSQQQQQQQQLKKRISAPGVDRAQCNLRRQRGKGNLLVAREERRTIVLGPTSTSTVHPANGSGSSASALDIVKQPSNFRRKNLHDCEPQNGSANGDDSDSAKVSGCFRCCRANCNNIPSSANGAGDRHQSRSFCDRIRTNHDSVNAQSGVAAIAQGSAVESAIPPSVSRRPTSSVTRSRTRVISKDLDDFRSVDDHFRAVKNHEGESINGFVSDSEKTSTCAWSAVAATPSATDVKQLNGRDEKRVKYHTIATSLHDTESSATTTAEVVTTAAVLVQLHPLQGRPQLSNGHDWRAPHAITDNKRCSVNEHSALASTSKAHTDAEYIDSSVSAIENACHGDDRRALVTISPNDRNCDRNPDCIYCSARRGIRFPSDLATGDDGRYHRQTVNQIGDNGTARQRNPLIQKQQRHLQNNRNNNNSSEVNKNICVAKLVGRVETASDECADRSVGPRNGIARVNGGSASPAFISTASPSASPLNAGQCGQCIFNQRRASPHPATNNSSPQSRNELSNNENGVGDADATLIHRDCRIDAAAVPSAGTADTSSVTPQARAHPAARDVNAHFRSNIVVRADDAGDFELNWPSAGLLAQVGLRKTVEQSRNTCRTIDPISEHFGRQGINCADKTDSRNASDCESNAEFDNKLVYFGNKAVSVALFNRRSYRRYRRVSLDNPIAFSTVDGDCASKLGNHALRITIDNHLTSMEKRRNTMDRWQRLRFGRRSASNPPEDNKPSASSEDAQQKRSSDKSERLKELTELLKSPIPPPRRVRPPLSSSSSVEKYIDAAESSSSMCSDDHKPSAIPSPEPDDNRGGASPPSDMLIHSDSMCGDRHNVGAASDPTTHHGDICGSIFNLPPFERASRPNLNVSNLESARTVKTPPLAEAEDFPATNDADSLPRVESRTIVGSYMQKTIPFRSASFSQVDYSSGKYICALKAAISPAKNYSVVDSANLTLPRKKEGSRGASLAKVVSEVAANATPTIDEPSRDAAKLETSERRNARIVSDLNLNLSNLTPPNPEYQQQRRRVSQAGSGPHTNVIIEEDNESSPTVDSREMNYDAGGQLEQRNDPAEEAGNETVCVALQPLRLAQAIEHEITHDEMVMHSPKALLCDEEYLTATQCLIPVSVYECVERDWNEEDLGDHWINACEVETSKVVEMIDPRAGNANDGADFAVGEAAVANIIETIDLPSTIEEQNAIQATVTDEVVEQDLDAEAAVAVANVAEAQQGAEVSPAYDQATTDSTDAVPNDNGGVPDPPSLSTDRRHPDKTNSLTLEPLPAISVTPGSSLSGSSFEDGGNLVPTDTNQSVEPIDTNSAQTDYVVEVRKRHSNGSRNSDIKICTDHSSGSASGSNSPKSSMDEKRRIDKSKRRKGIYIQWGAIDQHNRELSGISWDESGPDESLAGAAATVDGPPMWPDKLIGCLAGESEMDLRACDLAAAISSTIGQHQGQIDQTEGLWLKCHSPDRLPPSRAFESNTPDSEYGRPIWPKISGGVNIRRQSLSLQSSEEKDDSPINSSPSSRPHHKLFVLRSDSISDNEMSDRTPPSRDRASQSPAPGEQDLKRFSKRPLRGPYGQMLEAEMKKPSKTNYDGLLEQLNRAESPSRSFVRCRDSSMQSLDETYRPSVSVHRNSSTASSNSGPTAASPSSILPLPIHIRAASSPVQTDHTATDLTVRHKRSPSGVASSGPKHNKSDPGMRKDSSKKFSLDFNARSDTADDRLTKRASSESHEKFSKRNSSSPAAVSLLAFTNERSSGNEMPSRGQNSNKQKVSLKATPELLAELLKGSSEKLVKQERNKGNDSASVLPTAVLRCLDTRTHVVVELFNTEKSYVDSLETIVKKYLNPLKMPEYTALIDAQTVDEIFLMVPAILDIHKLFLDELRKRLDTWEPLQRVGDAFVEVFSKASVLEAYTLFVNNWTRAKDAIRMTSSQRPAFARFLEANAREHKGKLTLDNLIIKPVQKFPNYELIFSRLIKHTDIDHPDQAPLQDALKLVHEILDHLNCKEKEAQENDQRESALRDLEGVIEGISDLVTSDRQFLLFDLVSMPHGQGGRKERGFFLFSDLLIITSIKRRSGTVRKPNSTCPGSVASTLDTNKYRLLTKISIEDLEIAKAKDESLRKIMKEIEYLTDDSNKLQQILDVIMTMRCPHQPLEESIRDLQRDIQRQLTDRQTNDSQLCILELLINQSNNQQQQMTAVFQKPEKRTQWEQTFNKAKQKLAAMSDHHPIPDFIASIPIRKTRAGLQFTCASPTLGGQNDVWVCNSDGYVGQVCVLSLFPEPTVTSCNGVCNARILCVASVPASVSASHGRSVSSIVDDAPSSRFELGMENCQLDSSSSGDDSDETERRDHRKPANTFYAQPSNTISCPQLSTSAPQTQSMPTLPSHPEALTTTMGAALSVDDTDGHQSTMWLGTEDGCIHIYNCTDNIRTKKNKIKIQLISAVYSILYLDNRVFVSLANGDIVVYYRHQSGWNTVTPTTITLGSATNPVTKLLNVHGKLWCAIQGVIKILNINTLQVENHLQISPDVKPITNMAVYNNHVWISVQNSAQIKCYHSNNYILLFEVNLAPSVNKMLSNCDDIIRQHKAACLRVTSLLASKDLIWVGTSAGVILTISSVYKARGGNNTSYSGSLEQPFVVGIPFGHTGHVRFLTCVDYNKYKNNIPNTITDAAHIPEVTPSKKKPSGNEKSTDKSASFAASSSDSPPTLLIISGGDGYEDFRNAGANPLNEVAGREDSTNHLLLWQI